MAVYQYQQILSMYTQMIPFSRYDVLLYELGRLMLTDIKPDTHVLNENYRSYNTYRKDIGPDTSSLKINETYNNQDNIEDTYYEIKALDTSYVFDGIVLSKKFATNGNEMSLEDLFAEFYYDYLCAVDSSYLYSPDYGETYYFNQSYVDPVTQEEVIGGTYEILPVGTTYMNEDHEATNVEYDGTYVPTIGEILSGNLYIIIQSQGKPPRKIMFNNIQLPTLFINDDKYYTTDEYIMNDNQLMRLCDVKLYSKLGCRIGWEKIAYFEGENLKNMLLGVTNYEYLLDDEGKVTEGSVFFRIYYRAIYKNSAAIDETLFISGPVRVDYYWNGSSFVDQNLEYSSGFVDRPEHGWIWSEPVNTTNYQFDTEYFLTNRDRDFCNATTGYIPASTVENHNITVHIWFGMSLIFKGFSLNEPSPNTYTLHWYKYDPNTTPDPDPEPTGTVTGHYTLYNKSSSKTITYIKLGFDNSLETDHGAPLAPGASRSNISITLQDSSKNTQFRLQDVYMRDQNNNEYTMTGNTVYGYIQPNPWVYNSNPDGLNVYILDQSYIDINLCVFNVSSGGMYRAINSGSITLCTPENPSVATINTGAVYGYHVNAGTLPISTLNKTLDVSVVRLELGNLINPGSNPTPTYSRFILHKTTARANESNANEGHSDAKVGVIGASQAVSFINNSQTGLFWLEHTDTSMGMSVQTYKSFFIE